MSQLKCSPISEAVHQKLPDLQSPAQLPTPKPDPPPQPALQCEVRTTDASNHQLSERFYPLGPLAFALTISATASRHFGLRPSHANWKSCPQCATSAGRRNSRFFLQTCCCSSRLLPVYTGDGAPFRKNYNGVRRIAVGTIANECKQKNAEYLPLASKKLPQVDPKTGYQERGHP